METMRWLLTEAGLVLLGVLALINFFLLVHWRRGGRPQPLLLGLLTSLVLLSVEFLIVTPREHAADVLRRIERSLLDADAQAFGTQLADTFEANGLTKDAFVAFLESRLEVVKVTSLRRNGSIEVISASDARIVVRAGYYAYVVSNVYTGPWVGQWRLGFTREADEWRLAEAQPDGVTTWGQISRAY